MYSVKLSKEEQLRDEAIITAQKLFQQFGLQKTTMEDIAKAMGRGKSTLYYYYKSKEDIFDAVIMREMDEVFQKTKSAIDKVDSAEEKLKLFFKISMKAVKTKSNLYKIVRGEIEDKLSHLNFLIKKYNTREINTIKDILLLGIDNKEFNSSLREDVDLLAYSAVSALRSLSVDLVIEDKFPNWDERLNVVISVLIKGMK
jgi:AcrR family transcriptional regulator